MPRKPKSNSSPPNSPTSSAKKPKQEKKDNRNNKTGNSTPNCSKRTSPNPSPSTSGTNFPCNSPHFPDSVKNPAAKTPPQGHRQSPKRPPDGQNKLNKKTPSRGQKLEPTFVDKDKDTKNDSHTPTEVANNELPNRQLDEHNNACMPSNEGKDCRPKEVPTAFEQNRTNCSNEECVKTALEHTICKEDMSEEAISDDPCDADDVSETYDINVITFPVLFFQNIKHKLKIY